MRGEVCIGAASFLSLASLVLLIFLHVGQMSTSSVPKGIYMARLNASGYGAALEVALQVPIQGLYTGNDSKPLGRSLGLRDEYRFGLYTYCGFISPTTIHPPNRSPPIENATLAALLGPGQCSNHTVAQKYHPYEALLADMASNYTKFTDAILPAENNGFRDSGSLGTYTTGAYYLILLATIAVGLAFVFGIWPRTYTFLLSTSFAILGTVLLLIAAAMWTAMVNRSSDINDFVVQGKGIPLGFEVHAGPGLYILWAAFACLFASVVPYMISCCTYRG